MNGTITEVHYGDRAFRPDIHGILIPGQWGQLLSVLYTAAGSGPHPTVLLLHGIPGYERNLDLAQKPLLCIAGTLDRCTPPAMHCAPLTQAIEIAGGTMLQTVSYPTDHFFADHRLAIADIDFLLFRNRVHVNSRLS